MSPTITLPSDPAATPIVNLPDTFSGPMGLLYHLVRRDEMDINDIPMAKLTRAYLEEMGKLEIVDVDRAAEFLDLASRLLEIKSRLLLPPEEREGGGGEEDEDSFDPRADLVAALLEYRRFKDAARLLEAKAEEQSRRFARTPAPPSFTFVDAPPEPADRGDLFAALQFLWMRVTKEEVIAGDKDAPISVRMDQIKLALDGKISTRFSRLLSSSPTAGEMVGFFIAMLEMVRLGELSARQSADFGDIVLERREKAVKIAETPGFRRGLPPPSFMALFRPRRRGRPASRRAVAAFPAPAATARKSLARSSTKKGTALFPAPVPQRRKAKHARF